MTRARRTLWWAMVLTLSVATLAAAALGAWQMMDKNRQPPPIADQPGDRQAAVQAAGTGTVRLLSYNPDTLQQDFSAAEALLTEPFLTSYKQFTSQIVAPAARHKHVTTSATVVRAGVESLTSQKAAILVFVNQTTTSQDNPRPAVTASSVRVGMARVNGSWLIGSFDPV